MNEIKKKALTVLYIEYFDDLLHYGTRINPNEVIVEECIQDMFISLYETDHDIEKINSPKAYLMTVLRRDVLKELKKERALQEEKIRYWNGSNMQFTAVDILPQLNTEVRSSLLNALNEIPWRQREALYLKYYNSLSTKDIAEVMVASEQTILNTLCIGLKKLRKKINLKDIV